VRERASLFRKNYYDIRGSAGSGGGVSRGEISGRLLVKRRSLADFFCEDVVVALRGGQCRLLCACACFFPAV
jgi:hypothetical protein